MDIPGPVDWAVIAVPARIVPEVMEECGKKGVRLAVIVTAGFREIGGEGTALEEKVTAIARRHSIRIIGPNCLGIMMPHMRINATFDPPVSPRAGDVASSPRAARSSPPSSTGASPPRSSGSRPSSASATRRISGSSIFFGSPSRTP
ncbi:CoA-binding protein [Methanoculleus chikugoensis]|uniref:CoA-binding protein n=1 Tax=Methanoculleus chikugoensis TaxID=118126 RepID=UPI001FB3E24F|nr:CoA-binding protein [Methanoculleus chikugoensis]